MYPKFIAYEIISQKLINRKKSSWEEAFLPGSFPNSASQNKKADFRISDFFHWVGEELIDVMKCHQRRHAPRPITQGEGNTSNTYPTLPLNTNLSSLLYTIYYLLWIFSSHLINIMSIYVHIFHSFNLFELFSED